MARDKILVLGSGSRIGQRFAQLHDGKVVALRRVPGNEGALAFDPGTQDLADLGLDLSRFSHAVVLFAWTNPDQCVRQPDAARQVNVTATRLVLDRLLDAGVVPVFTSSEAVFDGTKGHYREDDTPHPATLYGKMKVEIETYLADKPALVLRLARVVGSIRGDGTMFSGWLDQLQRGDQITCARDQFFSPIHTDDVVKLMDVLMQTNAHGLFHLAGTEALSRLAMLEILVDHFTAAGGTLVHPIQSCSIADFPTLEPRPRDISMDCSKVIQATGIIPRSVATICDELIR